MVIPEIGHVVPDRQDKIPGLWIVTGEWGGVMRGFEALCEPNLPTTDKVTCPYIVVPELESSEVSWSRFPHT